MTLDPLSDEASFSQFIQDQAVGYWNNIARAEELLYLYERLAKNENRSVLGDEEVASDILRSAVVFVHATLEGFLRSVASDLLPYCDKDTLDAIPLVGTKGRAVKFTLGDLAAHRGKSILDVIRESVSEYLRINSYNDTEKLDASLKGLRIKIKDKDRKRLYPQLETLIQRRHQIVHRADKPHQDELEPLTSGQVWEWIDVVGAFMAKVMQAIVPRYRRPTRS